MMLIPVVPPAGLVSTSISGASFLVLMGMLCVFTLYQPTVNRLHAVADHFIAAPDVLWPHPVDSPTTYGYDRDLEHTRDISLR